MPTDAAHKRWWQIFEVIYGVPFLAGIGLQLAVPASLPRGFLAPFIAAGGAGLIVAGITFIVLPRGELAQLASRPTLDFLRASSSQQASSRARGIPST